MGIDSETLGAALAILTAMPDNAAHSAQEAKEAAEAAALCNYAISVSGTTLNIVEGGDNDE